MKKMIGLAAFAVAGTILAAKPDFAGIAAELDAIVIRDTD